MSVFRRAFLYVTRKRGRTALLFAILLVMACCALTGLSVWRGSEAAQGALRRSLGGGFDILVDWENSPYVVREELGQTCDEETGRTSYSFLFYSTVQLTPEDIAAVKSIPGVRSCGGRQEGLIPFSGLSLFPGTVPIDPEYRGRTKVLGVCSTGDDPLFTAGTLALGEGRHIAPEDSHVAVISRDLAERNELKLGDLLVARRYDPEAEAYAGPELSARIVGLFDPAALEGPGETVTAYDKIQNRVFVDLDTSRELEGGAINYGFSVLHATIEDPRELDRVTAAVRTLPGIDWEGFTIQTDRGAYDRAAAPLAALSRMAAALLGIILLAGAAVLALVLSLWARSRVHEMGALLSMGVSKGAILGQRLAEVLLIAVLAFGLAWPASVAAAGPLGDWLLERSARAPAAGEIDVAPSVEAGGDELLQAPLPGEAGIRAAAGPEDFALLCLMGLGVILLAVAASSLPVLEMKPREILSLMS